MTYFRMQDFCYFIMACHFGEIIEPSTRAIFYDSSDDEETASQPEFQFSWTRGNDCLPPVFDVIFVIHGRLSLAFTEAYILEENSSPAAEVDASKSSLPRDKDCEHHCKTLPSRLYIDNNKAFYLVSPTCSAESGFEITELLSPILKKCKKVIVFTNESLYNFQTYSFYELPPAFIRELKTSENINKNAAKKLSTPNFISGIPAAILSWCQIYKKSSSAFVCYSDQEKLDSITAEPYLSVIRNLSYNIIKNENPDFSKRFFYGKPGIICGSCNIYM